MTPLYRDATWSSVQGLVRSTVGCWLVVVAVGVEAACGVSTSIASSSWPCAAAAAEGVTEADWTLALPAFFLGGMLRRRM